MQYTFEVDARSCVTHLRDIELRDDRRVEKNMKPGSRRCGFLNLCVVVLVFTFAFTMCSCKKKNSEESSSEVPSTTNSTVGTSKESQKSESSTEESQNIEASVEAKISSMLMPADIQQPSVNTDSAEDVLEEYYSREQSLAEKVNNRISELASYNVISVSGDSCRVSVTSPNVGKLFEAIQKDGGSNSEEEILQTILDKLDAGDYEELTKELDLPIVNGELEMTAEFIDAMTGGIFSVAETYTVS